MLKYSNGFITDHFTQSEQPKPPLVLRSETEFVALIEKIDAELIKEKVLITARSIMAGLKLTERYDIELFMSPPRRAPKPDVFDSIEISIRLNDWFERRYGERLKMPFALGRVAFRLRGAYYALNCFTFYGSVVCVCDPNTFGQPHPPIGANHPPVVNALDLVEGLTPHMARSITGGEVIQLGAAMTQGMATYSVLNALKDVPLLREVLGDLDAAVMHIIALEPHPGQSKWASLQTCEKLVKAFLSHKRQNFKQTHNLSKLFDQAVAVGLPAPPPTYVPAVQCPAGVRYGEIQVTLREAELAHIVSLELCEVMGRSIGAILKRDLPQISEPLVDGVPMNQFLAQQGVKTTGPFDLSL